MLTSSQVQSRWRRILELRFKFYGRILRATSIRLFLKGCRALFSIEKRFNPIPPEKEKKILVIIFGGLGDCLLFDPLFRRIAEQYPGCRIDVLTAMFEDMWECLDSVDNMIYFSPVKVKTPWAYFSLFRTLHRNSYDIVAEGLAMLPMRGIFPIFTSLVFEATGAAIRIGRNTTGRQALMRPRELGFIGREEMAEKAKRKLLKEKHRKNPYTTHTIRLEPSALRQYHESARIFEPIGLQFERKTGEPRMRPNPSAGRWAQKLLRSHWGEEQDIIIGFTMETTRKIKSWALDNFFSVVTSGLQEQLKFVLLGVDRQPGNSPFKRLPRNNFLDLSGNTSIGEMIAVISQCNVFFSCDTGPAHIAQAIGIPSVVLFGPSNEMEFGPFDRELHTLILPSGDWSCRPCVLGPCIQKSHCMEAITVETVYNAIRQKITRYPKQVFDPNTEDYKSPEVICAI